MTDNNSTLLNLNPIRKPNLLPKGGGFIYQSTGLAKKGEGLGIFEEGVIRFLNSQPSVYAAIT